MKTFAISDLHLPGRGAKPMEVFGDHWFRHFDRIREDWLSRVGAGDVVLIPGDISWAMRFEDAADDLAALGALTGVKIILKGNHDYWWSSIGKLRGALPDGMRAIQNDAVSHGGALFAGTRGWLMPEDASADEDGKIYRRELMRLEMSLAAARAISDSAPLVAMTHFPPRTDSIADTAMTGLFERYRVSRAVYGHLHGEGARSGFRGEHRGVVYDLVSCDCLDFKLLEVDLTSKI